VESLDRFYQNQSIIEEFLTEWLADVSTDFGRLAHISRLHDATSGRYHHPALEESYSERSVHEALLYCHEELFERIIETTLEEQNRDLRTTFTRMGAPAEEVAARWLELEFFRSFVPLGITSCLREMFLTNVRGMLGRLVAERMSVESSR
jgi:hypothetical protein